MSISLRVFGKTEYVTKYRRIAAELPSLLTDEMKSQMMMLSDYIRTTKLSGDPLHRRSGALSRSINGNAFAAGRVVTGTVGSKGVPYAAVHELGLTVTIPSHQRLITQVFGKPVVPHSISVKAYTVSFPIRAYIKPSMEERRSTILSNLRASVIGIMRNAA